MIQRQNRDELAARIRELEDELREARRAAGVAQAAKTEFLGNVHHELRTPLNAVLGMLDLLLESRLDDEQHLHAVTGRENASALLRLINDIVDLSMLKSGGLPLEPVDFDMQGLLEEVSTNLASKARSKGLDLITHISGDLSPFFKADRGRIGQMLHHLVDNAIKFTNEGQVVLTARAMAGEEGREQLRITVSDTGIGIPAERRKEIFELFTQEDSSHTRGQGGLGFGLALVQRLTERMSGSLGMESKLAKGSSFWIDLWLDKGTLPLGDEKMSRNLVETGGNGESHVGGRGSFSGTRVLLVDDNQVNLKVAQRLLERQGCITRIATNGQEAVEAAGESEFDLILMDIQMPVMDGLQATRAIRAKEEGTGRRTPIVALTANVLADDRARCFEAGMEEFLPKPVGPKVLAAALSRFGNGTAGIAKCA